MPFDRLDNLVNIGKLKAEPPARAVLDGLIRFHGYRSENRYIVFQALTDTLQLPAAQWRVLDQAHGKRNRSKYEGTADLDTNFVDAVIRVARELEKRLATLELPSVDS